VIHCCIMDNASEIWFRTVTGGDSERYVASRVGLVQATLSRQLRADMLAPETVVAISRIYRVSPLPGLVSIGLITEDDIRRASAATTLADVADDDLVDEVLRRVKRGDHPLLTKGDE